MIKIKLNGSSTIGTPCPKCEKDCMIGLKDEIHEMAEKKRSQIIQRLHTCYSCQHTFSYRVVLDAMVTITLFSLEKIK